MLRNATSRLIAVHLLLVALSTALVLAFVYVSTKRVIEGEVREVVEAELRGLAGEYDSGGTLGLAQAIERRTASDARQDAVYLLADAEGQPIAGNLRRWPPEFGTSDRWVELELYRTDHERPARVSAASFHLPGGERLLVGRDAQARAAFDRTLFRAVVWALAAAGGLALASGWLLSRLVGRRVAEVVRTAEEIVHGDMSRRVPVRGDGYGSGRGGGRDGDEFDRLGTTLNRMLDRIEALIGDLRMVTDSVAHDLRSPLTRLRAHLDASLDESLPPDERRRRIEQALGEADGALRAFTALLEIARAEAGVGRDQFETVALDRLAGDVIDLYGPAAEERGVALAAIGGEARVTGHPQLLANAVANLVENAIRHAPAGSTVTLESAEAPGGAAISVSDRGPGIPARERARVLDRFVRLDESRGGGGAGLGLSLVAAVARLHGAGLALEDNRPGLRATLRFPAEASA